MAAKVRYGSAGYLSPTHEVIQMGEAEDIVETIRERKAEEIVETIRERHSDDDDDGDSQSSSYKYKEEEMTLRTTRKRSSDPNGLPAGMPAVQCCRRRETPSSHHMKRSGAEKNISFTAKYSWDPWVTYPRGDSNGRSRRHR